MINPYRDGAALPSSRFPPVFGALAKTFRSERKTPELKVAFAILLRS